jgi:hypothetical protein
MRYAPAPEKLIEALAVGGNGIFHLNGLTVRRAAVYRVGGFDEELEVGQDAVLRVKLAALCKLTAGSIDEPTAILRVHGGNRVTARATDQDEWVQRLRKEARVLRRWSKSTGHADVQYWIELWLARETGELLSRADDPRMPRKVAGLLKRAIFLVSGVVHPRLFMRGAFWRMMLPGMRELDNKSPF